MVFGNPSLGAAVLATNVDLGILVICVLCLLVGLTCTKFRSRLLI